MFRMRGAVVLVVAGALVAGACGGTEWNAGSKPKPLSAAQARAAAAAQQKAELPYVNALVAKYQSNGESASGLANDRCLASALIHGMGVDALKAHGLTANGLRSPRTTLDDLPTPTLAQADAIGAAVQRCQLSPIAAGLAEEFGATDAHSAACLTTALGQPQARRFLALRVLGRHRVSMVIAHTVVGLVSDCVDLAALLVRALGLPPDATIRQCVTTALHGDDADVKSYMTLELANADKDQIQQAVGALLVAINQCRPGAQTGFTVPPS